MSVQSNHTAAHTNTHHHTPTVMELIVGSNLLNVLILALAMIYLGNKFFPKMIDEKKKQIGKELEEAKKTRIKATEELETIKRKTENLSQEIEQIKEDAKITALTFKKQIEQDTDKELEHLRQKVKREITSNQEEAIQQIKRSTSEAAIKLAEESLTKVSKNHEIQKKLLADFMKELSKPSKN